MSNDRRTQEDVVISKLMLDRSVDNFWAIENFILRLGAIICDLRKKGWVFDAAFGTKLGYDQKFRKNYYYQLVSAPESKLPL